MSNMFRDFINLMCICCIISCNSSKETSYTEDFNNIHNRIWIGEDYWTIPLEEWRIESGRLECMGNRNNMKINLLTHTLTSSGNFSVSIKLGMPSVNELEGNVGISLGIYDSTDYRIPALCYFGQGIETGIHTDGYIYLGENQEPLPENFEVEDMIIEVNGMQLPDNTYELWAKATDSQGLSTPVVLISLSESPEGMIALHASFEGRDADRQVPNVWFDDWTISGTNLSISEDQTMGPIMWGMHTLSESVMKMTAQMPPLGELDNKEVLFQIGEDDDWITLSTAEIEDDSRTALFKVENWDATKDTPYRLAYEQSFPDGSKEMDYFEGTIRKDPVDRPLKVAGLTCQYGAGFPYTPVVDNLKEEDPDVLFFSGDQLYEGNGRYGIIRFPADSAILNYLGKWYMFGWAFKDLMRDRPTVCTPDDHDVFQGNLWGDGGENIDIETFRQFQGSSGGYVQPAQMVNAVHRTQCGHLPDPYDPTLLTQNISPWYTDMVYGRVSFAIISDRMFKSGPVAVATWGGRADHVKEPLDDPQTLDREDLAYLGPRQMVFLEEWISDWKGADMKVLLSQTLFAGVATHHGAERMLLSADLDSGGWPQNKRQQVIELIRKGFTFHINGDQHLPAILQYGLEKHADAGWAFCTPAIAVGYPRAFWPDKLGWKHEYRPDHGLPNTGYYTDGFGHPNLIYAIGNPEEEPSGPNRYELMHEKASGYGMIHFDQEQQNITMEAYGFLDKPGQDKPEQFPGWPLTIHLTENDGRKAKGYLPTINVSGLDNPVVAIYHEPSGELVYNLRVKGNSFQPKVYDEGSYLIKVGEPETDTWKELPGVSPDAGSTLELQF